MKRHAGGKSGEANRRYSAMVFRANLIPDVGVFFCMLREKIPEDTGPPEEVPHNRPKDLVVHPGQVPMYHDNEIESLRQAAHVEPEVLTQATLYAIPGYRPTDTTADGEPQPCFHAVAALGEKA